MPAVEVPLDALVAIAIVATLRARHQDRIRTGRVFRLRRPVATAVLLWLVGVAVAAMMLLAIIGGPFPG